MVTYKVYNYFDNPSFEMRLYNANNTSGLTTGLFPGDIQYNDLIENMADSLDEFGVPRSYFDECVEDADLSGDLIGPVDSVVLYFI